MPEASYFVLANTSRLQLPSFAREGEAPGRRDYDVARWLTSEVGVAAIPPSAFYCEEHKDIAADYTRFCFVKRDEELLEAKERLRTVAAHIV